MEVNYASNGKANAALATGIVGTSGWLLNGGLGNLLGGFGRGQQVYCNEDHYVNRYESEKDQQIAKLETKIAMLESNTYQDQKNLAMYQYVDGRFKGIEERLCKQEVYNATNNAVINCIEGQINQLMGMTTLYVNANRVSPEPMPRYTTWTAPTTGATT